MASRYEVEVTLSKARELKNINWRNGTIKPYVVLWVNSDRKVTSRIDEEGDTSPEWNQTIVIPLDRPIEDATLRLEVVHAYPEGDLNSLIGATKLPLEEIVSDGGIGSRATRSLKLKRPSGRPCGRLEVEVVVRPPRYDATSPYGGSRDMGRYGSGEMPQPYPYGAPPPSGYPSHGSSGEYPSPYPGYGTPQPGYPAPAPAGYPSPGGSGEIPPPSYGGVPYGAPQGGYPPQGGYAPQGGYPLQGGYGGEPSYGQPDYARAAYSQPAYGGQPDYAQQPAYGGQPPMQEAQPEEKKKMGGLGMGAGLAIGAAAGALGGLALYHGYNQFTDHLADKAAENVMDDLADRGLGDDDDDDDDDDKDVDKDDDSSDSD